MPKSPKERRKKGLEIWRFPKATVCSEAYLAGNHHHCVVEAPIYSVIISTEGRENVTLATTYEGASPVLGAKFLEDFGLKVHSETGLLKPTRYQGFAYKFES